MQRVHIRIVPPRELGIYSQILRVSLIPDFLWRKPSGKKEGDPRRKSGCEWKGKCPEDSWRHWNHQLKGAPWGRCTCGNATVATESTNGKFQGEVKQEVVLWGLQHSWLILAEAFSNWFLFQISLFCSEDTSTSKLLMWTSPQYQQRWWGWIVFVHQLLSW